MYGSVDSGNAGFDAVDRWITWKTITDVEKRAADISINHDGPITIVTGAMPKTFLESMVVRVPIETIVDQPALEAIIVSPLAALLRGDCQGANNLLKDVTTELWPSTQLNVSEEETDEPEQA